MKSILKKLIPASIAILILFGYSAAIADISPEAKKKREEAQRNYFYGLYDLQRNTISNVDFYTTNYGIFGLNVASGRGGGYWPRNSQNQYIFGGGVWFAAKKEVDGVEKKLVEVSYNPNNGRSWMVPGHIDWDESDLANLNERQLYRTYFSTDFRSDGTPINPNEGHNWPVWDALSSDSGYVLKNDRYFGVHILDPDERNLTQYPKGPAFISGEDIYSSYKDTDLNQFDGGLAKMQVEGYPLRLQFEQTIYSWGFGDYKDFIFIKFVIINKSDDILRECYMAPVMDVDLATRSNSSAGAANDRVRFCDEEDTLNLAMQWTNTDRGERNRGFGYLGFDFLESPATVHVMDSTVKKYWDEDAQDSLIVYKKDKDGEILKDNDGNPIPDYRYFEIKTEESDFIRKDKSVFTNDEQLGLVTFRNWNIQDDKLEDEARYNFMSTGDRDGDNGPGDKRFMMSTGPFHMRPGDTARVVVGIILAGPSKGNEATGEVDDVKELIAKDKFAQKVYDANFKAPAPPDRTILTDYKGLNNAVKIDFDATSELSSDPYEKGMDFLGYRIYRARRLDLDTFSIDNISASNDLSSGSSGDGPFGWRQIMQMQIPTPYKKSSYRAAGKEDDDSYPMIDSLIFLGPVYDENGNIEEFKVKVARVPQGVVLHDIYSSYALNEKLHPEKLYKGGYFVRAIDTSRFAAPWGEYFNTLASFTTLKDNNENVRWAQLDGFIQNYTNYDPQSPVLYKAHPFDMDPDFVQYLDLENKDNPLVKDVMVGTLTINNASFPYNPIYWKRVYELVDRDDYINYLEDFPNGKVTQTHNTKEVDENGDTIYIDTLWRIMDYSTATPEVINGKLKYRILSRKKIESDEIEFDINDINHINEAWAELYTIIQQAYTKVEFPDFEASEAAKNEVILPFFADNRTLVDIGDDDFDGVIKLEEDPTRTEKILNNVDYYYSINAYDEGDWEQGTPSKVNSKAYNINVRKVIPKADFDTGNNGFEIIHVDSSRIGNLFDFRFFSIDQDRVAQLYGGDTLELEMNPYWDVSKIDLTRDEEDNPTDFGLYRTRMTLRNISKDNEVLFDGITFHEVSPCNYYYRGGLTDNAESYVLSRHDSLIVDPYSGEEIRFQEMENRDEIIRTIQFSTGDFRKQGYCYTRSFSREAYGTMGFEFKSTLKQYGGVFRPDAAEIIESDATTPIRNLAKESWTIGTSDFYYNPRIKVLYREAIGYFLDDETQKNYDVYGSFNNGAADVMVEFIQPEGNNVEQVEVIFGKDDKRMTFNVPYLYTKVTNVTEIKRPREVKSDDSVTYKYNLEYMFKELDPISEANPVPSPITLIPNYMEMIDKYNIYSIGYVSATNDPDERNLTSQLKYKNLVARVADGQFTEHGSVPFFKQGKYYLTGTSTDGLYTIDFQNVVFVNGMTYLFDYANKEVIMAPKFKGDPEETPDYQFGEDFEAGDKVVLKTIGGVTGLPLPKAKVRCVVNSNDQNAVEITDDMMSSISVVPNPYYISHQGQQSPYDGKIYFTRLPEKCTIEIYTVTGDLLQTIYHEDYSEERDQFSNRNSEGLLVWDLLTKNKLRVTSQTLLAIIKTPDGAQTVKKFSIVSGGFRLIQE